MNNGSSPSNNSKFRYPEDKLTCEHICDAVVSQCLDKCGSESSCYRECWLDHDKCVINCPCNEECPDGCPEPDVGHSCETWFCQGYILSTVCASESDPDRDSCPHNSEYSCLNAGCCWTEFNDPYGGVPWCHYPKLDLIHPKQPFV